MSNQEIPTTNTLNSWIKYVGWFGIITVYGILFYVVKGDPFFGDAISTISRASWHILDSNFTSIAYPLHLDPGHPITFPLLYAGLWKLFGPQLPISHLVNFLFSLGILRLMWKWTKIDLGSQYAWVAVLLLLCVPLFLSQTAQMNTHLPLTFFAFGLAYGLRFNHKTSQIVFSSLMLITHLQGLYVLVPLWIWWFVKENDQPVKLRIQHMARVLLLPLSLFVIWLVYHYSQTGWWLSSPTYSGHRGIPSVKRIFINLILADWRLVDYGQIALFIVPVYVLFKRKYQLSWNHPLALLIVLYFFNAIALSITTQTGPAHRYLLPCLPFLVMTNVYMLKEMKILTWAIVIPVLLSGHFWFYPGKVMGDATLSFRDVFPLLEQVESDFPNEVMYSYAPLSNPGKFSSLNKITGDRNHLYGANLDTIKYVLRSNISGDFTESQIELLRKNWPVRTYQKGYVFVEVYGNPNLVSMPVTTKRRISRFEQWMSGMKRSIKGRDAH